MKKFEDEVWTERDKKKSVIESLKEKLDTFISDKNANSISIEDRYEMESCRTLTYEKVMEWIFKNRPENIDSAFLVRFKTKKNPTYPIMVAIMFLEEKHILLGKDYLKKINYCTFLDNELDNLFDGKESVILE
jgi:hypothetical protein